MQVNDDITPKEYARKCVNCPLRLAVQCYGVRRYTRTTECKNQEAIHDTKYHQHPAGS